MENYELKRSFIRLAKCFNQSMISLHVYQVASRTKDKCKSACQAFNCLCTRWSQRQHICIIIHQPHTRHPLLLHRPASRVPRQVVMSALSRCTMRNQYPQQLGLLHNSESESSVTLSVRYLQPKMTSTVLAVRTNWKGQEVDCSSRLPLRTSTFRNHLPVFRAPQVFGLCRRSHIVI